jgi:hypothetical protein
MMHHARPDPASDPVGDDIAKHGSGNRPPDDRRGIEPALLNGKPSEHHDERGWEKKADKDERLAERNNAKDGASPGFVMEHIQLDGCRIKRDYGVE